ncbi:MAG TPA: metalloregulator ArsR/SmtB family transcription factor [Chitinophagales bacterium]|nr:metalloregulator ArsR/SmtB family transcription factor [Chitinophagales bacterium]
MMLLNTNNNSLRITQLKNRQMPTFNQHQLDAATDLLRCAAHPLRLTLLKFIDDKGVINVNKIYGTLKLEQSITSQHLKIMRDTDLVEAKREGKFIYYNVNHQKAAQLSKAAAAFYKHLSKPKEKELVRK